MPRICATLILCAATLSGVLSSSSTPAASSESLVITAVNESRLVRLPGHRHPLAQARFDVGSAEDDFVLHGLELEFKHSAAQNDELTKLLIEQQDKSSTHYHRWLSPVQFGTQFGASDSDVQTASVWLQSHGFEVGAVSAGRGSLPFSGTASQVQAAFHTPIHLYQVSGVYHYANSADPQIPAAFAPLISSVHGLNDFHPRPGLKPNVGLGTYGNVVGPADFATIYNLTPLYQAAITGAGVTIAIASQSNVDQATPTAFYSAFGVKRGSAITYVTADATDPGITDSETEADLDLEVAGSLAPGARIILVTATSATDAAAYAINHNLAPVLSISYGDCESDLGAYNATISSDYQQAAAQGITVVVATGDQGAASCDEGFPKDAVKGLAVNGLASTPYDTAVGGTDFNPTLVASGNYWGTTNAPGTLSNALSYIPEMVWNESCTNPVTVAADSPSNLDPIAFCNNASFASLLTVISGSGGVSSCSVAATTSAGVCTGYPQPAWQAGVAGIQSYGARAIPDISLLANSYVICKGASSNCDPSNTIYVEGGTSAATPAFAAIIALLDQTQITASNPDGRQGLINSVLYRLAAAEYGTPASPDTTNLSTCNASRNGTTGTDCMFNDVTVGNVSMPCNAKTFAQIPIGVVPSGNCTTSSSTQTYGVLELNSSLAYQSNTGFDLATGIGSLNAANFVFAQTALGAPTGLTATLSAGKATLNWTADSHATSYNLYQSTTSGGEGKVPVQTGITGTKTTVTGITATGQTAYFQVSAATTAGQSYYSNEASVAVAPAAPTGVILSVIGTQLTIKWTSSPGAASYSIYLATSSGGEDTKPFSTGVGGTAVSYSGASPGATYFVTVAAVNVGGSSPQSTEASITLAPAAPASVMAVAQSASVVLTWNASYGTKTYNVFQGSTSGGESSTAVQAGLTSTSTTISNLTVGATYFFKITAANSGGSSPASLEVSATAAPLPPTDVTAVASGSAITVTWAGSPGASAYVVYPATTPGGEGSSGAAVSGLTYTTPNTLASGQTYYFKVAAANRGGPGTPSSEVMASIAPSAPTNLTAVTGEGTVTLTWASASGASSYDIYEGSAAGAESGTAVMTGAAGPTAAVSGLTNGATYYFIVKAVNSGGASAASNETTATVLPAQVTGLTAAAGNASVTVSWAASTGATSYQVFEGTTSGGESTTAIRSGLMATTVALTGLTNGTKYYFVVTATGPAGNSVASAETSATPAAPGGGGGGGGGIGYLDLVPLGLLAAAAMLSRHARDRDRR